MSRFEGRVALVTGGARGQGRSHAVALAAAGADVAIVDICDQIASVEAPMANADDLAETVRQVEATGRTALPIVADVRDAAAVDDAVRRTAADLGGLDMVVANAGILPTSGEPATTLDAWRDAIDTMLSGVYYTLHHATRVMLDAGRGGSIVITGSTSSFRGSAYDPASLTPGQVAYGAAKHGVIGIMRNFAMALGTSGIRINTVAPMGVRTPMVVNEHFQGSHLHAPAGWMANVMDIPLIEPHDVTAAVMWLLSDEARFVTGSTVPVDAGLLLA